MTDLSISAIRPQRRSESAAVREAVIASFGRTVEADLVDRLAADGDAPIALVAVEGGQVVGHVLFSPMRGAVRALALAPLSVRPESQGRGIGSALVESGLARAEAQGWDGVFVLGEPAFYSRFGFSTAAADAFASPFAGPHFQARVFRPDAFARGGPIAYAPAFATLA